MTRYLVTGGAGFIGSHLVEALLTRGMTVRVLDDFSSGRRENLAPFLSDIELIEGSLVDLATCRAACRDVDYVLHQAAMPSVPKSLQLPAETHQANVTGTLHVLIGARDAGVRRVVYAASSSAYGDTPTLPKVESMPAQPKSPYAIQKYTGELYCQTFSAHYGLDTVALRYFNIFGPRQDPSSPYSAVIPKFVAACLRNEAPTIFGDGTTSRDFTFVENVVEANLLACSTENACAGRVLNIACGGRVTLTDLALRVRAAVGRGQHPVYGPERAGDVKHSQADIAQAEATIGYRPRVSFSEGIEKTVSWYMNVEGPRSLGPPETE
ncbi:MAG: SDR family oxidoreductase [Myxococcota bacterium]